MAEELISKEQYHEECQELIDAEAPASVGPAPGERIDDVADD